MIIDEQFHRGKQSYRVHQIRHLDGHILRIRVERDHYAFQSHAVVEVLTSRLDWTPLTFTTPATWHGRTPIDATSAAGLLPIADDLAERARRILTPVPASAAATARRRSPARREATS